jgi:hypothetical protein
MDNACRAKLGLVGSTMVLIKVKNFILNSSLSLKWLELQSSKLRILVQIQKRI